MKKEFTDLEKRIARELIEYNYIARNADEELWVYEKHPYKSMAGWLSCGGYVSRLPFNHLFHDIQWEDSEPTLIRDIYDPRPQILTDKEKGYIEDLLRPYKDILHLVTIEKYISYDDDHYERITIEFGELGRFGYFTFPKFECGQKYRGMIREHKYTASELGLFQEDDDEN